MDKKKIYQFIYLAASCSKDDRQLVKEIAMQLRHYSETNGEVDYFIYCPFELKIDEKDENGNWKLSQEEWSKRVFKADIKEIVNCDIFLMLTPGRHSTAGTNFELGFVYGLNYCGHKIKSIVVQYTDDETSLMTYNGCILFCNTNRKDMYYDIITALNTEPKFDEEGDPVKEECTTILT